VEKKKGGRGAAAVGIIITAAPLRWPRARLPPPPARLPHRLLPRRLHAQHARHLRGRHHRRLRRGAVRRVRRHAAARRRRRRGHAASAHPYTAHLQGSSALTIEAMRDYCPVEVSVAIPYTFHPIYACKL
jgi:hypothetical protein